MSNKNFNKQIENNFRYYSPTKLQVEKYQAVRNLAKTFAYSIDGICPDSREKSLALTNLEQVVMWANAAIARNE